MIQSYNDYQEYLAKDALANINRVSCSWWRMLINVWYGNDSYRALKYLRALRYYEYVLNCKSGALGKFLKIVAKIRWHRLGTRYNIFIKPNVVGYGLRVPHLGGIRINCISVGKNCVANIGVIVGTNNRGEWAVIGDNVDLTIGSKVIGGVTIGDNVIVAPNSVVVKDVPSNAVVSGIPAKILKMKE